jgi:predicted permease
MAGVALVLLIICANVATLLLARAVARAREMGVRAALGAGRARLVRQLLTESLVLALLSAGLGLVVAWGGSRVLLARALGSGPVPPVDVGLDLTVLGFTVLLAVIAVALFGLAPALRAARVDLASSMRSGGRGVNASALGGRAGRFAAGTLLVGAQVALSLVLLAGAALLVRSLRSVEGGPTGLDREHLLIVDVDALGRGYFGERKANLTSEITTRLSALPGVAAVTFSENGIFSGTESGEQITVPGFQPQSESDSSAYSDRIGPDYARGIGGRVLQGRDISARDVEGAPHVILVNETFAHRFFRERSPIGTSIRIGRPGRSVDAEIVGVITDAKDHDLRGDVEPRFYMPYFQEFIDIPGALRFEVRATGNPAELVAAVRREILAVDANLPVNPAPLEQLMRESVQQERLVAQLATGFGILALLLAAIGLYGVMTYAVTRRTGEIGLRVALGAARADVVRLVVLDALRVVGAGLLIGTPLAIAAARLLRSQLHGVGVADPLSFGSAVVVLTATAAVAALLPALRASRVAPIVALARE